MSALCERLRLSRVLSSTIYSPNDRVLKFKSSIDSDGRHADMSGILLPLEFMYQITVETTPGRGRFEATVRHFFPSHKFVVNAGEISRLNRYGDQPHCVQEHLPHLRPYCYCKDLLPWRPIWWIYKWVS